jgi:hypothetical protein
MLFLAFLSDVCDFETSMTVADVTAAFDLLRWCTNHSRMNELASEDAA